MANGVLLASQFVAAGLLLLLAASLLAVKFNSRVNRAFALYLLLEGLVIVFLNMARLDGESDPASFWLRLTYYPSVALPFALLHFLVVYRRPSGGPVVTGVGIAMLAIVLALGFTHAFDRCAFACLDDAGAAHAGFLTAVSALNIPVQAVVAFVLAIDLLRGASGQRGRGFFLISASLALLALFQAGLQVSLVLTEPLHSGYATGPWIIVARLLVIPSFAIALLALMLLAKVSLRDPSGRRRPVLLGIATASTLASVVAIGAAGYSPTGSLSTLLAGFWRLLLPAMVAYALIRHRLFGIEVKVRASLMVAFVAAVYGGTYFLVSEGLEALVSARFGTLGGLAAAALLTLLARPITAAAKRLARFIIPGIDVKASSPDAQKRSIYRSQYLLLMEDDKLTPKERRLLDQLRDQLALSAATAAAIERSLAGAIPSGIK